MRTNINVQEFLRDTNKKVKIYSVIMIKYLHAESRKEFGANIVFLGIQLRVQFLNEKHLKN